MGVISKLEGGLDNAFDKAAGAVFRGPLEPALIAKRAEKQMHHEKLVGAGKQHAPTLYTVLVNQNDDQKLFAFYPTIAAEIETYLVAKGTQSGLRFDGRPLVRFIVDKSLKGGKFDVIAENVSARIIAKLREEEMEYYGLDDRDSSKPSPAKHRPKAPAPDDAGAIKAVRANRADKQDLADDEDLDEAVYFADIDDFIGRIGAHDREARQESLRVRHPDLLKSHAQLPLPGQARLTDLNAKKSYVLKKSPITIGRDASSDITIADANISRQHARFTQDVIGAWKVVDLDSTNGTKLNGKKITSAMLRDGDQLTLGLTLFEFREQ